MISFDAAHAAVHYPPDRRFRIWIRPSILIAAAMLVAFPVLAAWLEVLLVGLPHIPPVPQIYPNNFAGPHGFPLWVRYCHFFNFLFVTMLIRSGLSILADHPRLYFNNHCTPGSEWIRLTPITGSDGSALDREGRCALHLAHGCHARLPAYHRHSPGPGTFSTSTGSSSRAFFFVIMLFDTEQWRRLVPQSPLVLLQAWNTWVHYATFHLPTEFNGYYGYNALQQIAYFSVVFVFGPTGHPDRYRHVARCRQSLPLVREALWRQAIGALHSLSHHAQFLCLHRRACDVDRDDRLRSQHEPHRDGHRRP